MNDKIKVVLDTNIFIAAYWAKRSASARLISACLDGSLQALYSVQVKRETMRMLRQIKVRDTYLQRLEDFWQRARRVEGVSVDPIRSADPEDQKFLEAAAGGDADYLISNDVHLLSIGYIGRAEIVRPGSAARILGI